MLRIDTAGRISRFGGTGLDVDGIDGPPLYATSLAAREVALDAKGQVLALTTSSLVRRFAIEDPPLGHGDRSTVTRLETGWRRDWPTGEYELYDEDGLLTERATDPLQVETFAYDSLGRLTTRYDESGGAWTLSYDAGSGKLTSITDPSGRTSSVTIDSSGNLTGVLLPDASTIAFAYDTGHRLVTKTDPRGIAWHYAYGLYGSVESVQLGDGSSRQYRPKTTRNLLRHVPTGTGTEASPAPRFAEPTGEVDRQGQTIALDLDPYGKRRQAIMPGNLNWTFTRDAWGEVTLAQGPATRQWQQTFDDARRLVRERVATATSWRETRYTYPMGSEYPTTVKTVGSAGERTETRTYDSLNRVTSWTDTLGRVHSQTWAGNGRVATITEAGGRTWSFTYDTARNRTSSTNPAAQTTLETRNARGEVTRIETPAGRVTEFEYDALGRITLVRAPDDTTVTTTWQTINDCPTCQGDELGLPLTTTDAAGRTTTTTYDALGRATAVDAPMELDAATTYDVNGRPTESVGPGGLTTEYDWNSLGRLTSDTGPGPNGPTSRDHTYDDLGRRIRVEEPDGVGTTWEYDMDSQVSSLTVD